MTKIPALSSVPAVTLAVIQPLLGSSHSKSRYTEFQSQNPPSTQSDTALSGGPSLGQQGSAHFLV